MSTFLVRNLLRGPQRSRLQLKQLVRGIRPYQRSKIRWRTQKFLAGLGVSGTALTATFLVDPPSVAMAQGSDGSVGGNDGNYDTLSNRLRDIALSVGVSAAWGALVALVAGAMLPSTTTVDNNQDDSDSSKGRIHGCSILSLSQRGTTESTTTPSPTVFSLNNECRTRVAWGVASSQGKRWYMEDDWAGGILVPYHVVSRTTNSPALITPGAPLLTVGVFDGHGGWYCSKIASRNLLPQLAKHLQTVLDTINPERALSQTFRSLDEQMMGSEALWCGTTAVVASLTQSGLLTVESSFMMIDGIAHNLTALTC